MQLSAALGEMLASLVARMFGDGEAPVLASAGGRRVSVETVWARCCEGVPVLSWGGDGDPVGGGGVTG
jgi:hypothetical protein